MARRALAVLSLLAAAAPAAAQVALPDPSLLAGMTDWVDSVVVADSVHAVPEQWRGLRVGPADAPPPADLADLPDSLRARGREPRLRAPVLAVLAAMARAAARDGVAIRVRSGYRDPDTQRRLFETRLAQGRTFDDIAWGVAPPGYSEHMLGTTMDFDLGGQGAEGPVYAWLARNAWKFGLVESYPEATAGVFPWEPWHWRYHGPIPPVELTEAGLPRAVLAALGLVPGSAARDEAARPAGGAEAARLEPDDEAGGAANN
ncbi:MAG: D-alanyl-D-alanine carboxypeptidase family protein [Candidatus Krumholzibacteriota bacterium]|nr:D-alanyl-D-alanine carboxypeptidase family protein [Candidatus Krumholzibacteriota bacterium]